MKLLSGHGVQKIFSTSVDARLRSQQKIFSKRPAEFDAIKFNIVIKKEEKLLDDLLSNE